jgi:hypothetical protein
VKPINCLGNTFQIPPNPPFAKGPRGDWRFSLFEDDEPAIEDFPKNIDAADKKKLYNKANF